MQQKLKEEKEAKKATLDSRHQYIFSVVATKLCLEDSLVEDFALEGDQVRISSFIDYSYKHIVLSQFFMYI